MNIRSCSCVVLLVFGVLAALTAGALPPNSFFELDGNAVRNSATDWFDLNSGPVSGFQFSGIKSGVGLQGFTGGGSKVCKHKCTLLAVKDGGVYGIFVIGTQRTAWTFLTGNGQQPPVLTRHS